MNLFRMQCTRCKPVILFNYYCTHHAHTHTRHIIMYYDSGSQCFVPDSISFTIPILILCRLYQRLLLFDFFFLVSSTLLHLTLERASCDGDDDGGGGGVYKIKARRLCLRDNNDNRQPIIYLFMFFVVVEYIPSSFGYVNFIKDIVVDHRESS